MKYCMNCGTQITPGDRFCRECGTKLISSFASGGTGRYFRYSTHGMMFRSGFDLTIEENEGGLTAKYRHTMEDEKYVKPFEVDDAFFDQVVSIIHSNNGASRDGFHRHAQGVADGDSFSFSFRDDRGEEISASGYMAWPAGLGAAIGEIKALFEEAYEARFPNYLKMFQRYIDEEVVQKEFGDPYKGMKNSRVLLTRIPYVYSDPGYYNWGENPMPDGVLGYMITKGFEGNDPADPGYRAVVVLAQKQAIEGERIRFTNIKIRYYGMDSDQKPRLLQEFTNSKEAVVGNNGWFSIFNFGSMEHTTVGILDINKWDGGANAENYWFGVYRLKKDEMEELGVTTFTIPRGETMNEENLQALCKRAEDGGLMFLSVEWSNAWRRTGTLAYPLVSSIAGFRWMSEKNGKMQDDPEGNLRGTPIEGWGIDVYRL
ncbi:MAG: zinc ribbon domain-containing protein [Lachnospiraceae bacterium]|nr:zinc ribbon domain-containing protein [Lachnospiraceae bacterium]